MLPSVWLPENFFVPAQESKISLTDTAAGLECVRTTFGCQRAGRSQGYYHKGIWKTLLSLAEDSLPGWRVLIEVSQLPVELGEIKL